MIPPSAETDLRSQGKSVAFEFRLPASRLGKAGRDVAAIAVLVELPQPVAGIGLKLLEQQADDVALAVDRGFGHKVMNPKLGLADRCQNDDAGQCEHCCSQNQRQHAIGNAEAEIMTPAIKGMTKAAGPAGMAAKINRTGAQHADSRNHRDGRNASFIRTEKWQDRHQHPQHAEDGGENDITGCGIARIFHRSVGPAFTRLAGELTP